MHWRNPYKEIPEKGRECIVYKPNDKYQKYQFDTWDEIHEAPVSWSSATICVGEGWQNEDDFEAVQGWMYVDELGVPNEEIN